MSMLILVVMFMMLMTMVMSLTFIFPPRFFLFLIVGLGVSCKDILSTTDTFNFFLASFKFPYQNENLNLKTNTWQQLDAMQKKSRLIENTMAVFF